MTRADSTRYTVRAFNTATASANKIHDDAVARRLGFRGGLVPGVDVYAYLCHLPTERWGRSWLERGTIDVRLESPVYDGDEAEVTATPDGPDASDLALVDPAGTRCVTGRATLGDVALDRPDPDDWPSGPPPADPPPASPETLTAGPLGSIEATWWADRSIEYLDDIRETLPLYRSGEAAHPGWLLRYANYVLTANVRLGPWIHVASRVQLLGIVTDGARVETRAKVVDTRERGGHRFVDLDVLQVVDGDPVARVAHTAIYQPRGT
jgi:acyl dehydratase